MSYSTRQLAYTSSSADEEVFVKITPESTLEDVLKTHGVTFFQKDYFVREHIGRIVTPELFEIWAPKEKIYADSKIDFEDIDYNWRPGYDPDAQRLSFLNTTITSGWVYNSVLKSLNLAVAAGERVEIGITQVLDSLSTGGKIWVAIDDMHSVSNFTQYKLILIDPVDANRFIGFTLTKNDTVWDVVWQVSIPDGFGSNTIVCIGVDLFSEENIERYLVLDYGPGGIYLRPGSYSSLLGWTLDEKETPTKIIGCDEIDEGLGVFFGDNGFISSFSVEAPLTGQEDVRILSMGVCHGLNKPEEFADGDATVTFAFNPQVMVSIDFSKPTNVLQLNSWEASLIGISAYLYSDYGFTSEQVDLLIEATTDEGDEIERTSLLVYNNLPTLFGTEFSIKITSFTTLEGFALPVVPLLLPVVYPSVGSLSSSVWDTTLLKPGGIEGQTYGSAGFMIRTAWIMLKGMITNSMELLPDGKTLVIYDEDGVTELVKFDLTTTNRTLLEKNDDRLS